MELQFTAKWAGCNVWTTEYDIIDWEIDGNELTNEAVADWRAENPDVDAAVFDLTEGCRVIATMFWTRKNDSCCCWS